MTPPTHVVIDGRRVATIRTEPPCEHRRTRIERVADRDLWGRGVPRDARICTACGAVVADVPVEADPQPCRVGDGEEG